MPTGDFHRAHERLVVIEPPSGWRLVDWRELWAYRELLWVLTTRDVKIRYKQTVLGTSWAVIRPFLTMVVFTVIFGKFAHMPSDGFPYPIFLYSALLPWTFFSAAIATAAQSVVGSASLVSKVYFPRLIVPLSSVGGGLVDFLISGALLLLMMIWYHAGWTVNLLAAVPLMIAVIFAALGFGTLLAAVTVAYRDFTHLTPFIVQIWMFVTPVVFPLSAVPPRWRPLLYLNPMTGLIEGFRSAFLGKPFDVAGLASSCAIAAVVFAFGVAYFEKVELRFADII